MKKIKNTSGFTLIELLAIIVILSIIAFITIPKINQITEKSRRDSAAVSALGYIDAVEKFYFEQNQNSLEEEFILTGEYDVEEGFLIDGEDRYKVKVKGTIPSTGSLEIKNGDVLSGCLTMGKYRVAIENEEVSSVEKGQCGMELQDKIDLVEGVMRADGFKYLLTPKTVYFNPVTGEKCDDYVEANSVDGVNEGCMKWYAYSLKGKVTNMLLDHNLNTSDKDIAWITKSDYNNADEIAPYLGVSFEATTVEYGGNGRYYKGPLTALGYLKTRTAGWSTSVEGKYRNFNTPSSYSIDYSDYKARLITAQEVAYIKGTDYNEFTTISNITSLPTWMSGTRTYWTASYNPDGNTSANTIYTSTPPSLSPYTITTTLSVRPVITVPTSIILEDD